MPDVGSITTVLREVELFHGPGTTEDILVEHLSLTELIDHHLDFSGLLQKTTIRVSEIVDTNYKQIGESRVYPDDYGDNTGIVRIVLDGAGGSMKITLQSELTENETISIKGTTRDTIRI